MSEPILLDSCPGCDDAAVGQSRDSDGLVYWVAKGWPDPYPGDDGARDLAIDYCPFCGEELEDIVEVLPLPSPQERGQA